MRHQNIELFRFLAALGVVYFHAVGALRAGRFSDIGSNPFTELGAAGVDIFFVISGFVSLTADTILPWVSIVIHVGKYYDIYGILS